MKIELRVPAAGESITEVEIGDWLKSEGEGLKKDEPVAVIETEKATVELPAPESGTLTRILRKKGEAARVGESIGEMETGTAPAKRELEAAETEPEVAGSRAPTPQSKEPPAPPPGIAPPGEDILVEHGLRAEETQATGFGASATEEDVPPHIEWHYKSPATPPAPGGGQGPQPPIMPASPASVAREEQVVRMTLLRRTAAKRLVEAQHTAALLTTFNEADMSAVSALRQQYQTAFQGRYGIKLGLMSFFVKATIDALKLVPQLNAEVRGMDIVYRNYHDIGIAVSSDRGLVVPVLCDADRLGFAEIERAIQDLAQRARENKLKPEELQGGTFTITNGGLFGSLLSTPLVNPPQSGVLGLHTIQDRPVVVAGQIAIRPMMFVALTYDHRVVDGREAVIFLRRVKETIENPARMLLEI